ESAALLTSAARTLSSDAAATAVPGRGESDRVRNAGHNIATAVEIATIATTAVADNSRADKSGHFICFSLEFKTEGHLAMSTGRLSQAGPAARLSSDGDSVSKADATSRFCAIAVLRAARRRTYCNVPSTQHPTRYAMEPLTGSSARDSIPRDSKPAGRALASGSSKTRRWASAER